MRSGCGPGVQTTTAPGGSFGNEYASKASESFIKPLWLQRTTPILFRVKTISSLLSHRLKIAQGLASESCITGAMERRRPEPVVSWGLSEETDMKLTIIALSAAALVASAPVLFAQGASSNTPGHEMQKRSSKKGSPGASGYSPGHETQQKGSKKGTEGASGYAPGHSGTTSTGSKY